MYKLSFPVKYTVAALGTVLTVASGTAFLVGLNDTATAFTNNDTVVENEKQVESQDHKKSDEPAKASKGVDNKGTETKNNPVEDKDLGVEGDFVDGGGTEVKDVGESAQNKPQDEPVEADGVVDGDKELQATTEPSGKRLWGDVCVYNVEPGDTLSEVSRILGTSVDELAKLNNIIDVNMIYEDSSIKAGC